MELELGLALPVHSPAKGFDLNDRELDLWSYGGCLGSEKCVKNKRSSEEAFGKIGETPQGFPLVSWNDHPNEDDERNGQKKRTSCVVNKKEPEENHLVGWPPIKSWRKKQLYQHQEGQIKNDQMVQRTCASNSLYVKVKMEGVAIARKIDLRLYHSYETLTNTLIGMFAKYRRIENDGASFTLTYQDKEGDWLLAGDVPWQTFIESVHRLEILKNGG